METSSTPYNNVYNDALVKLEIGLSQQEQEQEIGIETEIPTFVETKSRLFLTPEQRRNIINHRRGTANDDDVGSKGCSSTTHNDVLINMEIGLNQQEYEQEQDALDGTTGTEQTSDSEDEEGVSSTKEEASKKMNGTTDTGESESETAKTVSRLPKQVRDMYTTADWWSLWIGLESFALAMAIVFFVPFEIGDGRARYVIPQPMTWSDQPFDAWDAYGAFGTFYLFLHMGTVYLLAKSFMGKINDEKPALGYAKGFAAMSVVAVISFWLGRQEWCARHGLGYAIFAIVFGMLLANVPILSSCNGSGDRKTLPDALPWLKLVAKDGEFFIKSSLVLLAVEFSVLGSVGLEAIVVAWVGSPVALVAGFLIGTRLFQMDAGITLLVAVGSTWCGASAISAVAAIVGSPSADISLSISVVAFFTVVFTFVQAYVAIGVGMPDAVAGAWIGGSVDQTGNVIASAAIVSEEATEIAGIVKIVLNSGLGVLSTIIAFWWQTRRDNNTAEKKPIDFLFIWEKFPKFVLGYILCSAILTVVLPQLNGTPEGSALQRAVLTLNKWWFSIAFVGIGIGTSIKDLWHGALKSGVLKLYLATNCIDIVIALGLAYAVF